MSISARVKLDKCSIDKKYTPTEQRFAEFVCFFLTKKTTTAALLKLFVS